MLGLEKGAVDLVPNNSDNSNRYIAVIMRTQSVLFQMDNTTCVKLYDILKSALSHASWRIYENGPNGKPADLALHLTGYYLSTSKVKTLRLHKWWPLSDVRMVTHQGNTVSCTMFSEGVSAGYKQFILKNEQTAGKCKAEIQARIHKNRGTVNNVYFVSPEKESSELGGKQLAAASPPVSEGRFLSNMEVSSSICTPRVSEESNPFFCQIEEGGVLNNPLYNIKGPVSPSHHPQPPPLPTGLRAKKPPLPTAANLSKSAELKSPRTDDVSSGSSAEEEKRTAPPVPVRTCKPQFRQSVSMEEGKDRWDKFVSVLGVEEEIAKSMNRPDRYSKKAFVQKEAPTKLTRTARASIVPQRPKEKTYGRNKNQEDKQSAESSYSLYTFLFQVWNSKEINADTLGMKLPTWHDFVVYFELLPGDVKDWRVFAERIGMSHMDIQVIDNYSRRFNQCSTAIVMLFWQQNSQNLKEEYSRPVLLKILRELEREDLIEVVEGQST